MAVETCFGVRIHSSTVVNGRNVPVSNYYVGRGKDGQVRTSAKLHNAALMSEVLAGLLVTKLNNTGHHAEVCELLCDENSTIHDNMVDLGEEAQPPPTTTNVHCGAREGHRELFPRRPEPFGSSQSLQ
jgi:hypothetical protein